ncbi:pilus assembly PilX family protein [Thiolapillus sp.]
MKQSNGMSSIYNRQKGVALVISLILLTVITMLSLTAMRSANLDTKIAVNHQHKQFSFQAAENALAQLTRVPPSTVSKPGTLNGDAVTTTDWYQENAIGGSPNISADLTMDMTVQSRPGQYKFSGYGLNLVTIVYQADAVGSVDDTNTTTHNRMEVALLRY